LFSVAGGNARSSTVALVNPNPPRTFLDSIHHASDRKGMASYDGNDDECPMKCQHNGTQLVEYSPALYAKDSLHPYEDGQWWDVSGRLCCRNAGQDICQLNSPGNTCNCLDVNWSEPCYIDTRCGPFQTVQDGKCKAKPYTRCSKLSSDGIDCTVGYRCRSRQNYEDTSSNKVLYKVNVCLPDPVW